MDSNWLVVYLCLHAAPYAPRGSLSLSARTSTQKKNKNIWVFIVSTTNNQLLNVDAIRRASAETFYSIISFLQETSHREVQDYEHGPVVEIERSDFSTTSSEGLPQLTQLSPIPWNPLKNPNHCVRNYIGSRRIICTVRWSEFAECISFRSSGTRNCMYFLSIQLYAYFTCARYCVLVDECLFDGRRIQGTAIVR